LLEIVEQTMDSKIPLAPPVDLVAVDVRDAVIASAEAIKTYKSA